jgi:energy-coupling factor transporter ATP-binding protein EcfA2
MSQPTSSESDAGDAGPRAAGGNTGDSLPLFFTPEGTTTALIAIVGPRGGGKSTLMAALVPQLAPEDRLVLISPVRAIGSKLGLPVEVRYGRDEDNEEYFHRFLTTGKRVVLVMDEFDEFCPGGVTGKNGGYCCDSLYRLVNYARNDPWCIGMVVSFRGASDVTTNLLRAANVLFVARTQEPNALDYFSRYLGRQYGQMLHDLPDYVFVVWAEGRLFGYVRVEGGEVCWIDPPKGWPTPENASVMSAGQPSDSTDTSAPPAESADTETTPATPASG